MSVRREVVTLSQLLRRKENSNSRRGCGRAPPLPLQTSRHRAETPLPSAHKNAGIRQTHSAPLTEKPVGSGCQSLSFTQSVLGANRVSTSQSEFAASSQMSSGFPVLSQEVYEGESEQLSAMTSMSQSSFSQTQSQNLLGSSQDGQLDRLQHWKAQQASPPVPPSSVCCDGREKLQELEQNVTKAFVEQIREQKEQQHELLVQVVDPIKKSIAEIEAKLAASGDHQQQTAAIGELAKGVDSVVSSVSELCQQNLSNKVVYEETQTSVINEATAMKAALTELQARVETVEGSVKSCSGLISQVLEAEASKHEALLSAVSASSCTCPKTATPAEDSSDDERATRKRRRSARRHELDEEKPACYTSFSSTDGPPSRTRTCSPPRYEVGNRNTWYDSEDDETDDIGLHHALNRIEALRAKRRNYQLSF